MKNNEQTFVFYDHLYIMCGELKHVYLKVFQMQDI